LWRCSRLWNEIENVQRFRQCPNLKLGGAADPCCRLVPSCCARSFPANFRHAMSINHLRATSLSWRADPPAIAALLRQGLLELRDISPAIGLLRIVKFIEIICHVSPLTKARPIAYPRLDQSRKHGSPPSFHPLKFCKSASSQPLQSVHRCDCEWPDDRTLDRARKVEAAPAISNDRPTNYGPVSWLIAWALGTLLPYCQASPPVYGSQDNDGLISKWPATGRQSPKPPRMWLKRRVFFAPAVVNSAMQPHMQGGKIITERL
jgi:hypothetical protein